MNQTEYKIDDVVKFRIPGYGILAVGIDREREHKE